MISAPQPALTRSRQQCPKVESGFGARPHPSTPSQVLQTYMRQGYNVIIYLSVHTNIPGPRWQAGVPQYWRGACPAPPLGNHSNAKQRPGRRQRHPAVRHFWPPQRLPPPSPPPPPPAAAPAVPPRRRRRSARARPGPTAPGRCPADLDPRPRWPPATNPAPAPLRPAAPAEGSSAATGRRRRWGPCAGSRRAPEAAPRAGPRNLAQPRRAHAVQRRYSPALPAR